MRSKSGPQSSAEAHVREIRRATRKKHSAAERIRMLLAFRPGNPQPLFKRVVLVSSLGERFGNEITVGPAVEESGDDGFFVITGGLERRPGRCRDFGENLTVALLSGEIFQGRDKTMRIGAIQPHQIDTIVVGPMLNLRLVNGLDGVHCFTPGT